MYNSDMTLYRGLKYVSGTSYFKMAVKKVEQGDPTKNDTQTLKMLQ